MKSLVKSPKNNLNTDAQVMIVWVLSKKNFVAVFTSMDKNHLKEDIAALKFKLNEDDIRLLDNELLMKRFNR